MTISSSLNAGVSGLNANASRLATISDNIANASTFGYKRAVTDFGSLVSVSGSGQYSAGGVRSTTTRLVDQQASFATTDNPTDIAVRGRGMIPVTKRPDPNNDNAISQMMLTTTGSFRLDEEGYLVSPNGLALMGWKADSDGTIPELPRDSGASLEPVKVNTTQFAADPTTGVDLKVNLPATDTESTASGDPRNLSVEFFGTLGSTESLSFEFTPTIPAAGSSNEWTMVVTDSASGGAVVGEYVLTFNDDRADGGTLASVTMVSGGAYDAATGSVVVTTGHGPIELNIGEIDDPEGMSQLSDTFAPVVIAKDGSPVSNMVSVEIDANGYVRALYDSGISRTIYQVPLVDLPNPNGMVAMDYQTYLPSYESGPYFLWDAGDGPTGEIVSYAREESATDVAAELTSMIQTQRSYSTNAKVIQTVDEMLQETTNIKR